MVDLSRPYNRENFKTFLKNFLPVDFTINLKNFDTSKNKKIFKEITLIGKVPSLSNLPIFEIKRIKPEKSRIKITKELFRLIENHGFDNALVVTFSDKEDHFRLSLISSKLEWVSEKSVKKFFSNPKRLSFLLGINSKLHTVNNQLLKKGRVSDFNDLVNRFSLEPINEEFFQNYLNLYLKLEDYLNNDSDFKKYSKINNINIDVFSKKILGQIVFCYFLQKKKLLGADENKGIFFGNINFIRENFELYSNKNKNFFNDFLEPLFYLGLNKKNENDFCKPLNCKVPYLNGGLFQELPNYSWKDNFIKIPNDLFSNDDKNGILDIFDLYNFTIDETNDFDVEVAIDPEMLGVIFENLLPENIRKSKGAHYTPKEIVEYIAFTSLKSYLNGSIESYSKEIDIYLHLARYPDETIRRYENNKIDIKFSNDLLKKIDEAITNIKICDPAVGSGAFLIGMLNYLINIKKLTLYLINPEVKINTNKIKRKFIEKNLFGVDIDEGAVEICKLRIWLALIIDDETITRTLPNLDFRIIQGNSLIEEYLGVNLDIDTSNNEQLELTENQNNFEAEMKELYDLQKKFFNETNSIEKKKLIKKINKLYFLILKQDIENKFSISKDKKKKLLESLNSFNELNNNNNFFPWKLSFFDVFLEKKGFDIIIANPPYLREKDFAHIFEPVNKSSFGKKYHTGKMNYWYYFLHKAIDKTNPRASISFITHRYWLNSSGSKELIKRIKDTLSIYEVLDIGKVKTFDKVIGQHIIVTYSKYNIKNLTYKKVLQNVENIFVNKNNDNIESYNLKNNDIFTDQNQINFNKILIDYSKDKFCTLCDKYIPSQGVIESPDKISKKNLEKIPSSNINIGDGVFVLSDREKENLRLTNEELEYLKKYLSSSDVEKYKISFNNQFLIYANSDFKSKITDKKFSNLKNHLNKFKKYITSSNGPYGLHRPRNENFFTQKKIIFKNMFKEPEFAIDESNYYVGFSFAVIIKKSDYPLEYLLALLNSKFGLYWFIKNSKMRGIGVDVTIEKLKEFPIPLITEQNKNEINLILKIIDQINSNGLNKVNLNKIDELIYKICNLDIDTVNKINLVIEDFLIDS